MKYFASLLLYLVVIMSCSKQNSAPDLLTNGNGNFLFSSTLECGFATSEVYNGITVVNGMLSFQDLVHFQNTLTCLGMQLDAHHEEFDTLYGHLSLELIEAIEDSIGFSDWQPLEDFESTLNFTSRRSIIESAILAWEGSSSQDDDKYPDDWDGWGEEFRTLLDSNMQVKIADSVYTFDILADSSSFNNGNLAVGLRNECKWYARCREYYEYTQGRRVRLKATMYGGVVQRKIKCKVVHQKRSNGKWKRSRELISAHISGRTYNAECEAIDGMGAEKGQKKARWRRVVDRKFDGVNARWREESVAASTNIGNQQYSAVLLCW